MNVSIFQKKYYLAPGKNAAWLPGFSCLLLILFLITISANLSANSLPVSLPNDSSDASVTKISATEYKIGSLLLNSERREVYIQGNVNMKKGMIELLACGRTGKLHESVLVLDLVPHELHVALLLLGLEPRGNLKYQGDPTTPEGDSVEIYVEWNENGVTKKVRGEDMVYNLAGKKTMERTPWIFTGSRVMNGVYRADIEQSIVTTYHDPMTVLDNPLKEGGDDTLYKVNEDLVPAKGTPVRLTIRALSAAKTK
jgi:hypothetical protein